MACEVHCPACCSYSRLQREALREDASAFGGDLETLLCLGSGTCSQGLGVANCASPWEPARIVRWAGQHEPRQIQGMFP